MESSNPTHAMEKTPPTVSSEERVDKKTPDAGTGNGTSAFHRSKSMSISLPRSGSQGLGSEHGPPTTPSARDGVLSTNSNSSKSMSISPPDPDSNSLAPGASHVQPFQSSAGQKLSTSTHHSQSSKAMSISPPHNDHQTDSNDAAPSTPGPTPELADAYGSITRNAKTPANSPAAESDAGTSLEFGRGDTGSSTARDVVETDSGEGEIIRGKKRGAEDDVDLSGERKRSKDGDGRADGADENGSRRSKSLEKEKKKDSGRSLSYGRSASEARYVPDPRQWMDESETTAAAAEEVFGIDELCGPQPVDEGGSVEVTGKASAGVEGTADADLLEKSPKKTGGAHGAKGSEGGG